ncbi:hypothetical protein PF003_g32545 [Phytophthora fragariae]|nr:hypothetical protein PF003_g32545 [Phytophthora fragariae]
MKDSGGALRNSPTTASVEDDVLVVGENVSRLGMRMACQRVRWLTRPARMLLDYNYNVFNYGSTVRWYPNFGMMMVRAV